MAKTDEPAAAVAEAPPTQDVPEGDDFELVYVCNPEIHGKDAAKRPAPGRVTRAWLALHSEAGWVQCDANGEIVKG